VIPALTRPRSIVVIGASTRVTGLAGRPLDFLNRYGFAGDLHVVRPDGTAVLGVPAVRTVAELPDDLDLAVIAVSAAAAVEAYEQCSEHGVKAAVIVASGFDRGTELERSLREAVARSRTRLIGPNCVGFLNTHENVYATVASSFVEQSALRGGVGVVTQSGGLGNAVVAGLAARGLGISSWYSSGSEFDVGALDIIRFLIDDPNTQVITAFVEGLREGEDLVAVGRQARLAGKPVFFLKGGLSQAGGRSARLHTGKVSSGPAVWNDIAAQAGIALVSSVEGLLDAAAIASGVPGAESRSHGPRTVILSASGGLGVLLADRCQSVDVPLAELTKTTANRLADTLGLNEDIGNPVDIGAASDAQVSAAIGELVDDPDVDIVLLAASRIASKDYQVLGKCLRETRDRVGDRLDRLVLSFLGPTDVVTAEERARLDALATIVDSPFRAVEALAHFWRTSRRRTSRDDGTPLAVSPRRGGAAAFRWPAIDELARQYELPLVRSILAADEGAAAAAAVELGFPVVVKAVAPNLWHRSDLGLVRAGITSGTAVRDAFSELEKAAREQQISDWEGVLVQPMVAPGLEVIVGARWDAELGPILSVGLGGTSVELLDEVHHLQLPVSAEDLRDLVRSGALGTLLAGFRGKPALDEDGLVRAAAAVMQLFANEPDLSEVEMNPVIVAPDSVSAVDFKVVSG
jgi:acyl-CoA synthetase (NDP forming)